MTEAGWITIAAFWVAVAAVVISFIGAMVSYYVFRSAIDPTVVVYATADESRATMINLVIENVGKGLAKDVRFELSAPLPERAFGHADAKMPNQMRSGPLITGIPALGPGAKRVITWGQYGGLSKALGNETVNVRVRFRSDPAGIFAAKEYEILCPLDVKSFEGTDASDRNGSKEIAQPLERIADLLKDATSGYRSLKITIANLESSRAANSPAEHE